ncbi:hypothetical protein Gotur_026399 [Gossypium turneri]
MAVGREDVEILKPRIDKREYRRIVLRNSLQCASSMNVGVVPFVTLSASMASPTFLSTCCFMLVRSIPWKIATQSI